MDGQVRFKWFSPGVPSYNYMFMLEAMTYKACVTVPRDVPPEQIKVQVWTSAYDIYSNEGKWHAVDLGLISHDESTSEVVYGKSVIITSANDFQFTFRMRLPEESEWRWSHDYGNNGFAHVEPPRAVDAWTLAPDYNHIIGTVHLGNFLAATHAKECGFTHVLNVADNLDMVYESGEVCYLKLPLADGACNRIQDHHIIQAVDWLRQYDTEGHKILVNCRAGIGRAGSIALAYMFGQCLDKSYHDVYEYISQRRFIYPHYGLCETLYRLFPRT